MKPRIVIGTAIIVLLIAAGAWWVRYFFRPLSPGAETAAIAPKPQPASAPLLSSSQVVLPTTAPASTMAAAPAAKLVDFTQQIQLELKPVFPDIGRLVRDDLPEFYRNYTQPDKFDPKEYQVLLHLQELDKENPNPAIQAMKKQAAQAWEDMANQTPVVNEVGDEATYLLIEDGRSDRKTFIKIGGRWYLK